MAKTAKTDPTRPSVGDRRRRAMIEAAYALFMERGFEAVSVDEIIAVAGGSKATLYKYFGNKEGILRAVVESLADEMLRGFNVELSTGHDVRDSLRHVGKVLVDLALSDNAINQHRQAVAHARAFPDLARLWYDNGPRRTMEGIAAFLARETAAGNLRVDDPVRAAWLFGGMLIFKNNMKLLVGARCDSKAEMEGSIREAVDVFLAAYGT